MKTRLFALLVEIGEIAEFEFDLLDGFGRAEALVELGAGQNGLELDLGIGAALAGLDVIDLDRDPQAILMVDDEAGADFVAVDLGHVLLFVGVKGGHRRARQASSGAVGPGGAGAPQLLVDRLTS